MYSPIISVHLVCRTACYGHALTIHILPAFFVYGQNEALTQLLASLVDMQLVSFRHRFLTIQVKLTQRFYHMSLTDTNNLHCRLTLPETLKSNVINKQASWHQFIACLDSQHILLTLAGCEHIEIHEAQSNGNLHNYFHSQRLKCVKHSFIFKAK